MTKVKRDREAVLTVKEAAEYLGIVSYRTLNDWRRQSRGPRWINMEGMIGYRVSDLEQYLEECSRSPGDNFAA